MDRDFKRKVFGLMADKFETDAFRDYFLDLCAELPDYVFTIPSSTSKKYHSKQQCVTPGGQIIHVYLFSSILNHLLRLEHNREIFGTPEIRDAMRVVPMAHDAIKCGWNGSKYTVPNHPKLAAEWILTVKTEHDIPKRYKEAIAGMCEAHSGEWNKDRSGNEIMKKPENQMEFLIHECDILASRSDIIWDVPRELSEIMHFGEDDDPGYEKITWKNYTLPFGKYKGKTWEQIDNDDPGYIQWALDKLEATNVKKYLIDYIKLKEVANKS